MTARPAFHLLKRAMNRQLFNPTVVKHNDFDCHIATAKQCGTHWIKYMLSLVLCELYDVPKPEHIRDDAVVGHTKTRPQYNHIPQIAVTHSHPHYLLRFGGIFKVMSLPKFVVLVRDPRDILVSTYEKTKGEYLNKKMKTDGDAIFAQYLRGDVTGKKRIADIWDTILFFNSWGAIIEAHKDEVLLLKYEDMKKDAAGVLRRVCDHIGLENVTDEIIQRAVEGSSREKMREKLDESEAQFEKSVNLKAHNFSDWYDESDRAFAEEVFVKHLKYPLGYDLWSWP